MEPPVPRVPAQQYSRPSSAGTAAPSTELTGVSIAPLVVLALTVLLPVAGANLGILHQVPEGHVGVYWRGGALLSTVTEPGFHTMVPFVTRFEAIQVTMQTDMVVNIPCGTKGGVMIYFDKIEVVNRLRKDYVFDTIMNFGVEYDKTWIYDKIHHEINQFCSAHTLQEVYIDHFDQIDEKVKEAIQVDLDKYAPGIEIISVRVTKPTIPKSIARNYEQMEEERTKARALHFYCKFHPSCLVLIAIEKQKVVEKEAETEKKRAVTDAESAAHVSQILMSQRLQEKESIQRQQAIENDIFLAREKALTDAQFYKVVKEAEANEVKLTPAFLELRFIEAIANNSKMFFGEKIPNMILDQRLLGNHLSRDSLVSAD
eukprot:SM000005S17151  [mRNA]  locus=s5:465469:468804:- [translate_table: standard]